MSHYIYVTTYLEDILIYSTDEETHKTHLMEVFNRFSAGFSAAGVICVVRSVKLLQACLF